MEGAILAIEKFNKDLNPRSILWEAYNFAKDTVGSSTACIVTGNLFFFIYKNELNKS